MNKQGCHDCFQLTFAAFVITDMAGREGAIKEGFLF
jgi:hypothetical protein